MEVELDQGLLADDGETLHRHVRNAYLACSQAVQEELARHRAAMTKDGARPKEPSPQGPPATRD